MDYGRAGRPCGGVDPTSVVKPVECCATTRSVTAAIYVETIFGLNGLRILSLNALSGETGGYDLPTINAVVFTVATTAVVLNLLADILLVVLDLPSLIVRALQPCASVLKNASVARAPTRTTGDCASLALLGCGAAKQPRAAPQVS